ncbi:hypothetical protein SLEP1_g12492 [Rubroshorea leprosula]|uniref:Uncharacterized protein n=1 Tax=Rubroshorea leprosula TaxID=152421 RepID=A0AAV5IIJ1_9ROSI|nr:hypothetical protein SLEP1_g12492 [Rubroshorea leprosula]
MSSEGIMSVVGSEVMPLEYGGMDSESSLSPFSSERTMEERREQGVGEKEEEEIPSNIMEVKGNGDRCYDPELDIVFEVRGYVSELGSRGSLRGLVGNCNLHHHILIRPAGVNERACSAPRDHWMLVYVHYLATGLRGKSEKGWYYFGPRTSNKENKSLFTAGPSSIKGWKEKFFFVDDTEWSRRDAEVEHLSAWKAKKTKQNNYKLNEDEVEEVEKLVREEGDLVDIMYLTSSKAIKAAELYGPSSLSEAEIEGFLNAVEGLAIPKKPRKKSKTSNVADKGAGEERGRGARPWQRQGTHPSSFIPEDLFDATNIIGAKRFLNATLPEVDRRQARDEAVSQLGARVVRHSLESASWREREELLKKNKEMQRKLDEVVPTVTELQNDKDTLSTRLVFEERKRKICEDKLEAQDKYIENMNKGMGELKKNVNLLVYNGMEEHIGNFLNSSTFESIINLYWLQTAILAFTDYRKKVKAQYPEVDVTTVTFGDQEEGVEEDDESLSVDFRPLIKLRWERDAEGRTIFPPSFDAELVAVEEEEEVWYPSQLEAVSEQGSNLHRARFEPASERGSKPTADVIPPPIQVPSELVSPHDKLAPSEAEVPPLPAGDEPPQPPLPIEEQPPSSAE